MLHLFFAIFSVVFTTLSGILSVAIIVAGYFSWPAMIAAMIPSAIAALPITYIILKQMDWTDPDEKHGTQKEWWYRR
jgi:NAD-dependent oxidoreductase involved in siderophore biosynthesis